MNKKNQIIIISVFLVMAVTSSYGQPAGGAPPGGPAGGTPGCWPPPCVPVDGGISFLIAIGAAFGGKKMYDKLKE